MLLMEMLNEAGCPKGVVNVIHGAHDSVNFICDNRKKMFFSNYTFISCVI